MTSVESWSGKDRGDENFPVGGLIRPALRPHVHAYYAFARNADDIADDEALAPEDKVARLDAMEAVLLGREPDGRSPSAARLRGSLAACGLPPVHATDLLVAFRRDALVPRTASWEALLDYCRHSAMPVGRQVLDLHGEDRATHAPSDALCAVLQVLNHLQDCGQDLARLGRCYIPDDMLADAGASVEDLRRPAETPGLRRVFDGLLDRCDALTGEAAALPPLVRDRRLRLEVTVILNLARRLAGRLRRGDPLAGRVKLRRSDFALALLGAVPALRRPASIAGRAGVAGRAPAAGGAAR